MYKLNNEIFYITATRFNDITWDENVEFRKKMEMKGCIYGVPREISISIELKSILFVFEMNNSKPNQIMGMGIIRNYTRNDKHYKIYSDNNYNRFHYSSKYRISREQLIKDYNDILQLTERLVFKGKDHIKRGQSISRLPEKKTKQFRQLYKEFVKSISKNILHKD